MDLRKGDKVRCTKSGVIGRITKLGNKASKVRIPFFDTGKYIHRQIPNKYLERR